MENGGSANEAKEEKNPGSMRIIGRGARRKNNTGWNIAFLRSNGGLESFVMLKNGGAVIQRPHPITVRIWE